MWIRRVVLVVLVTCAGTTVSPAADAMSLGCGGLVTGDTTLTRSIRDCTSAAVLTFTVSSTTLDLNGHSVDGSSCGAAILVNPGVTDVRIVGPGTISDCTNGIDFGSGASGGLVSGVTVISAGADGIRYTAAPNNTVRNTTVAQSGEDGISAETTSTGLRILRSTVSSNAGDGISGGSEAHAMVISASTIVDNFLGIDVNDDNSTADRSRIVDSVIRRSESDGVQADGKVDAIGNLITDNQGAGFDFGDPDAIVRDNVVRNNDSAGIEVDDDSTIIANTVTNNGTDGIDAGSGNTIKGNTLISNGGRGITGGASNLIKRNIVKKNVDIGIRTIGDGNTVVANTVVGNEDSGIVMGGLTTTAVVNGNVAKKNGFADGAVSGSNLGIEAADLPGVTGKNTASGNDVADPAVQCFPARLCT